MVRAFARTFVDRLAAELRRSAAANIAVPEGFAPLYFRSYSCEPFHVRRRQTAIARSR